MANLGLSVDELLKTTRAVRKRLDFDRPVPDQVLRECVEYAIQAPTGSNVQGWHFVLVTERDKIEKIAAIYKKAFDWYRDSPVYAGRVVEGISEQRDAQQARVADSADYLAENMHRSPALFIPCMEGRNATAGAAGSIVPRLGVSCSPHANKGSVRVGRLCISCTNKKQPTYSASHLTRCNSGLSAPSRTPPGPTSNPRRVLT